MTKLEFTLNASTCEVISCDATTASILDISPPFVPLARVLACTNECAKFREGVARAKKESLKFFTLNVVFLASMATTEAFHADRSPIEGIFASPEGLFHSCGVDQIACFTHVTLEDDQILVTALEYDRQHRADLLRQEFGFWLLKHQVEKAVIATTLGGGDICYWNRFASELYGYERDEAIGFNIGPSFAKQHVAQAVRRFSSAASGGEPLEGNLSEEKVKYIVGVTADYSQLYNTLAELETLNSSLEKEVERRTNQIVEQERYLHMIGAAIQHSDTGAIFTDKSGRIIWVNEPVLKIFGTAGRSFLSDSTGSAEESFSELFRQANTGTTPRARLRLCHTLEQSKDIEVLSMSVRNFSRHGSSLSEDQYFITLSDYTSKQRAEKARVAAKIAETASQTKTEMMQMLSHELRTPLQGIMGVASTIIEDLSSDSSMLDSLRTILASSRLLLTLINNVLDIGKIDANMMDMIELSDIPLSACIADSLEFCGPFAAIHDVSLVFQKEAEQFVSANRLRLEEILVNLVGNAIKYTMTNTKVTISLRKCSIEDAWKEARCAAASDLMFFSEEKLLEAETSLRGSNIEVTVISVRDQGTGIPASSWKKVFSQFVQLENSKEKDRRYEGGSSAKAGQSSGSGLGLNLAMKFVTRMNGHIWFENRSPGADFSFFLANSKRRRSIESAKPQQPPMPPVIQPQQAASFRTLIVDDSTINLKVMKQMLSRLGVQQILVAHSGKEALQYIKESSKMHVPNLILTDLQMPGMTGYELLKQLRELKHFPQAKIMACSADWSSETEAKCVHVGFEGLIRKPITLTCLKEILSGIISENEKYLKQSLATLH
ncbi:ethylene receptor 1 [Phaeodactylum tricornutum CCAP 1055/1]|uniref:histidine kinase n=1 Tax=Phaeodactylum tricornutum (strain CCAP 1055/1) TaxID=556484 RepID=B7FXV2_PHATC|nr:ethylene receptor 1 [Phaeodactylum tricornutum CCAP 1055/1]EEC48608.1 ethylene receptor 1 [Phaeodactylum tricornutum CCAP 1055/1]|eukprot:XP_002179622.1 ethylene receptor 1 [Phaeodactylum tricornutum CCAP 1055/1]